MMEYLVQVGSAIEVEPDYPERSDVRLYRKDGRTFMGHDTDDGIYFCSDECLNKFLADWKVTDNNADAYLRNEYRVAGKVQIETADVTRADSEELDSPEHCGVCEALVRVPLSSYGYEYVAECVVDHLRYPAHGRPEIIEQWVDAHPDAKDDFEETWYFANAFAAYVECALWSSTFEANEDGTPADHETGKTVPFDDHFDEDDIAEEAKDEMREDLLSFIWSNVTDLAGMAPQQVGHDFWLSRNGHGAGFFDRGLGERGERLQAAAGHYGSQDLYIGNDGKVYV